MNLRSFFLLVLVVTVLVSGYLLLNPFKKTSDLVSSPVSKISSETRAYAQDKEEKAYSVDGKKYVTLKKSTQNKTSEYILTLSDGSELLREVRDESSSLSLPGNTWDPGEEYVFLESSQNGGKTDLLLKTSGENFSDSEKAIDVGKLFNEKKFPYQFKEATGWAGSNLLIIETVNEDKTNGPLYWFEVSSGAFIQLY